jgi:hypothetical protein
LKIKVSRIKDNLDSSSHTWWSGALCISLIIYTEVNRIVCVTELISWSTDCLQSPIYVISNTNRPANRADNDQTRWNNLNTNIYSLNGIRTSDLRDTNHIYTLC